MGGGQSAPKAPAVRRNPIFEKANNDLTRAELITMLRSDVNTTMPPDAKELIIESVGGFFFLEDEESDQIRMDLLLRAMKCE